MIAIVCAMGASLFVAPVCSAPCGGDAIVTTYLNTMHSWETDKENHAAYRHPVIIPEGWLMYNRLVLQTSTGPSV